MKIIGTARQIARKVAEGISDVFDGTTLRELARKTGFVRRSTSRTEGDDFVRLMTTEILGEKAISTEGLCDILREISPKAEMTPQALGERLNKKESVEYLKEVFGLAMAENFRSAKSDIPPDSLSSFGRVFTEDSTQITLHEKLAEEFRGSGGSASSSALKIDLIYEIRQNILQNILISDGKVSDQSRADEIMEEIRENDLILRDLGYFTLESLRNIGEKDAFFLSRLLRSVGVFLSPDADASSVSIPKYLSKKFRHLSVADTDVWLGKEKLPCRLVAYRLPDEVVRKRRGKARKNAKKKGRQPTKEYLGWLGFAFYVTNVPRDIWEPEIVGTVYRLRWHTELTFRYWKSLMNIHILRGTRRERVECFLFGRLIAIVIMTMLCGFASWYANNYLKKEISFHKVIRWLIRKNRLTDIIRSDRLRDKFIKNIRFLCKQKRKRKTTRQLLEERIPYMESFLS